MEIVIALVVIVVLVSMMKGGSARATESDAERRQRQATGMAIMDHYDVGPFRKDGR